MLLIGYGVSFMLGTFALYIIVDILSEKELGKPVDSIFGLIFGSLGGFLGVTLTKILILVIS